MMSPSVLDVTLHSHNIFVSTEPLSFCMSFNLIQFGFWVTFASCQNDETGKTIITLKYLSQSAFCICRMFASMKNAPLTIYFLHVNASHFAHND